MIVTRVQPSEFWSLQLKSQYSEHQIINVKHVHIVMKSTIENFPCVSLYWLLTFGLVLKDHDSYVPL